MATVPDQTRSDLPSLGQRKLARFLDRIYSTYQCFCTKFQCILIGILQYTDFFITLRPRRGV